MNDRKRWLNKQTANNFMRAYEKKVDKFDKDGKLIPGNKRLKYWSAYDYVNLNR